MKLLIQNKTYTINGEELIYTGSKDHGEIVLFQREDGSMLEMPLGNLILKDIIDINEKVSDNSEDSNRKYRCECGGGLQVVQEISGSYVYPIDSRGNLDWYDREFYGEMNEYIECKECQTTVDARATVEGKIEFYD